MHSVHDGGNGQAGGQFGPVADSRFATSVTILGVAMCLYLVNMQAIKSPAFSSEGARQVRIVDPAFCKDQTWPYIDARCLKRVDDAERPAADQGRAAVTANAAAPTIVDAAPRVVGANENPPAATGPLPSGTDGSETPSAAVMPTLPITPPPAASVGDPAAPRAPEIRHEASSVPTDAYDYQRVTDGEHRVRSGHSRRHSQSFFGFRF